MLFCFFEMVAFAHIAVATQDPDRSVWTTAPYLKNDHPELAYNIYPAANHFMAVCHPMLPKSPRTPRFPPSLRQKAGLRTPLDAIERCHYDLPCECCDAAVNVPRSTLTNPAPWRPPPHPPPRCDCGLRMMESRGKPRCLLWMMTLAAIRSIDDGDARSDRAMP
jgi:hypothetical protein